MGEGFAAGGVGESGAIGVVTAGGSAFSPKILGSPVSKTPAIQAIIIVARVPINKAFQPS